MGKEVKTIMSTPYQRGVIEGKKAMVKRITIVFQNIVEEILLDEGLVDKWIPKAERVKKK